jgi:hypothetical protein
LKGTLEIRIPISPTRAFFHQVRLFNYGLRRLGGVYADARLLVVVGDNAALEDVRAENAWSNGQHIEWITTPRAIFDKYGIHGTADYRYVPPSDADIIILSDADTVFVGDIDPVLAALPSNEAIVAGHMAHLPPPPPREGSLAQHNGEALWTDLFRAFCLKPPLFANHYSMDPAGRLGRAPAYFNLGFIALTKAALPAFRENIFPMQDWLLEHYPSHMRCQIAVTLLAAAKNIQTRSLPAQYNLANDVRHLASNYLAATDARVVHYLRGDELKRETAVLPENFATTLAMQCENAINRRLQTLLADFARDEFDWRFPC